MVGYSVEEQTLAAVSGGRFRSMHCRVSGRSKGIVRTNRSTVSAVQGNRK